MSTSLKDQVYMVTGGSRGFGLAIAQALVAHGARVCLLGRSRGSLDAALALLGPDCALGVEADVGDKAAVARAFEAALAHFGRLDGLVNNAGMARPSAVEKLVESEVLMQVHTNFLGTVFCSQLAIPLLRGGPNPRIITVSSASAVHFDEMSHLSIYAASKAAVERFTRDLRTELRSDGIGVSCIRPGNAWTGFADGWEPEALTAGVEAWRDSGTYMDQGMEPAQVGSAVAFALAQPPGVAVDLLEIRPNIPTEK